MPEALDNPEQEETGLLAAWRYLHLAGHALVAPVAENMPHASLATRLYLVFNTLLYAIAAAAFLLPVRGLRVGHTGLWLVDNPVLHALWGVTALFVSLSQVATLLSDRWTIWQICAVGTATWASAFGMVTLVQAHIAGSYGGAFIWLWIVGVHFLFISHQLVPHNGSGSSSSPMQHHPASHTVAEEEALIAAIEQEVTKPPPPKPPKSPKSS